MNGRSVRPASELLWSVHRPIWGLAVLFFVFGDAATTGVGVVFVDELTEAGPVPAFLIQQYGFGAIVLLKLAVLGGCVVLWRSIPRPLCVGVPLGLAVVGTSVTGWNTYLLVLALLL